MAEIIPGRGSRGGFGDGRSHSLGQLTRDILAMAKIVPMSVCQGGLSDGRG
jgi:hypothetical protein